MKFSQRASAALAAASLSASAMAQVTVNVGSVLHKMDGFGFSQAFGRASQFKSAPATMQKQALDYLFSTTTGAGFSIIRNDIGSGGSGNSIEPSSPGSPGATPKYSWDDNDSGQVWFSQQAMSYGVKTIYADAWSAPGFMKTNGNEANGGYLCGTTGHTCSSGDWRQAYANYLVQYVKYYNQAGIPITHLGFLNEPDYVTSYASMQISSNAAEAISFIPILSAAVKSAGLSVKLTCCDATGWPAQKGYTTALMNAGMQQYLSVITSHMYSGDPNSALSTTLPVWMTEGDAQSMGFVTTWHSSGAVNEGMTWANKIATGIVSANLSAYFFWEGFEQAQTQSASHLIDSSGSNANPSGSPSGVVTAAFQNTDGSVIVVLTNSGSSSQNIKVSLSGFSATSAQAWISDNSNKAAATTATLSGGTVAVTVSSNGVVTIKLAGGGSTSPPPPPASSPPPPPPPASSTTFHTTTTTSSGPSTGCTQTVYGQCGGIGWTGCTSCASGSTCSASNSYYSQCIPA